MKQLSLRFKLYALVVSLLLIMGISIVVTAQLSLGAMEKRLSVETRDTVQGIVMDQLSATAGKFGELVVGWHSFSNVDNTVFIDDVLAATERTGCMEVR